jgi:hypothetical protein
MTRPGQKLGGVAIGIAAAAFVVLSTGGITVAAFLSAGGVATAQTSTTTTTTAPVTTTTASTTTTTAPTTTTTTAPATTTTKAPKTTTTKAPKTTTTKAPTAATTRAPKTTTTTTTTTLPTTAPKTIRNWVYVAQSIGVSTDTTGKVSGNPLVFTQITANGTKPTTVKVPMSSSGLRNLLGFKDPPIVDGHAVYNLDLNGQTNERTKSNFPKSLLPLKVKATYWLNGKKMPASDILGKSGLLKVTYTVQNMTSEKTNVTFKSIFGNEVTMAVHVPIPIASAVAVTFPSSFTNLDAPGAGTYGNGNGTIAASWTMFLFQPLGDLTQSVSYEAQVTNASVPSATVEAEVIPPEQIHSLPTISEPGEPGIPTVTVGVHLAAIQAGIQRQLAKISAAASKLLAEFQAVAVPAAQGVSTGAAKTAADIAKLSTDTSQFSTSVGTVSTNLAQRAANASTMATTVATAQANLAAIPAAVCSGLGQAGVQVTPACPSTVTALPLYQALQNGLTVLATIAADLSTGFTTASTNVQAVQTSLATVATDLTTGSNDVNTFSQQALALSNTLAEATLAPSQKQGKTIQPTQLSGKGDLDAAVAQLDAAITSAGNSVDANYATLYGLDTRATENLLMNGDAHGATAQVAVAIYAVSGANTSGTQTHLALIIGVGALFVGACVGLGLYRIRKGWPSSLAPTTPPKKKSPAGSA